MKNLKNDIADLKAVADQLLLQTTMNTVKINVLKSMVLVFTQKPLMKHLGKIFTAIITTLSETK